MGGKQSTTQQMTNVINDFTQIINNATSTCQSAATEQQVIEIQNASGDVNINGLNWTQCSTMKTDCKQSANEQTDLTEALSQEATAIANQSAPNVSLNFTIQDVNQIQTNMTNLSKEVLNVTNNQCSATSDQLQRIYVGTAANVNLFNVSAKQVLDVTNKCVQDSITKTAAYTAVEQTLSAKSSQKVSSIGLILIIVVCIIVVIVVAVCAWKYGGKKKDTPEVAAAKSAEQVANIQKKAAKSTLKAAELQGNATKAAAKAEATAAAEALKAAAEALKAAKARAAVEAAETAKAKAAAKAAAKAPMPPPAPTGGPNQAAAAAMSLPPAGSLGLGGGGGRFSSCALSSSRRRWRHG